MNIANLAHYAYHFLEISLLQVVFNDEGDPMKSWWRKRKWRGDSTYAALVITNIINTEKILRQQFGLELALLSNDNAFLNDFRSPFDQRTLLARLPGNTSDHSGFVPKPVLSAMAMLAMLGPEQINVQSPDSGVNSSLALLATRRMSDSDPYLAAVSVLMANRDSLDASVTLEVMKFPPGFVAYEVEISKKATNPRRLWKKMGKPLSLTTEQFQAIYKVSLPRRILLQPDIVEDPHHMKVLVPQKSVKTVQFCFPVQEAMDLKQPNRVEFYAFELGIVIVWKYNGYIDCLRGFRVQHSSNGPFGPYKSVNQGDESLFNFWQTVNALAGWYRLQAVNIWDVAGPFSIPKHYE